MVHIVLCVFLASSAVRHVSGQLKHRLLPCAPEGRAVWGTPCFLAALFVIFVEVCCRVFSVGRRPAVWGSDVFLYDICLHVWRWAVGKAAVGPSHLWMLHPSIVSCRCKYLEKELCLCGAG